MRLGAVLSLVVLASCAPQAERPSATTDSSRSTEVALSGVTPAAIAARLAPSTGSWSINENADAMDDNVKNVSLSLQSDSLLDLSFPYSGKHATLVIRCRKGHTDLYVVTHIPVHSIYGEYDETAVRYRFDDAKPQSARFSESTDHSAIFAPEPVTLARRLATASRWRLEFTPYSAAATTVSFTLAGLDAALPKVASACRWSDGASAHTSAAARQRSGQAAGGYTSQPPATALATPFAGTVTAQFYVDTYGWVELNTIGVVKGSPDAAYALRDTLDKVRFAKSDARHVVRQTFVFAP